jgi:hypothetical protein
MTSIPQRIVDQLHDLRNDPVAQHSSGGVKQQLRELDKEYREKLVELNKAEACFVRARKLDELSYHRRRKAILANSHDTDT